MNGTPRSRSHDLVIVAETGDRFSDFAPYVASINSSGTIAFQAALKNGGSGIFTGTGGPATTVADTTSGSFGRFQSHPAINAKGELSVYAALPRDGQGVFLFRDGEFAAVALTGDRFSAIGPLGPTMNDRGDVAFRADVAPGVGGILVGNGGMVREVADTRGDLGAFHGLPVINRQGTVLFRADRKDGSKGLFVSRHGALKTVADTHGRFGDFAAFPSLNDDGIVAFCGTLKTGGAGVFTLREGQLTTVVEATGAFESFRNALINQTGAVVFAATPRGGMLGAYAGPDPLGDRVIGLGDPCFGSTVADFALNPVSVNNAGQIAVRVKLTDGRQFILRADPVK